jgi:hypothetical protein
MIFTIALYLPPMTKQIETVKKVRALLLEGIKDLTTEQLNKIPAGFNNNIIWNLGHLIAAQQGICYKRTGATPLISDDFWERFKPGSKPEVTVEAAEIENIKSLFLRSIDQLEIDCDTPVFNSYTAVTTRYGIELASIDDGINFLPFHEGLHLGTIMAIKRLVL